MSSTQTNAPQRVVILGGGPAGVAAAYWLSRPEQKGRYAVTLYSQGWRLGGKCASGRDAAEYQRIEEHGLHCLMGCYWNGFTTMRACYEDWREVKKDPKNPFQTWKDAFLPQYLVSLMDEAGPPPAWAPWNFPFPQLSGEPGDPPHERHERDAGDELIIRMAGLLEKNVPSGAPYATTVRKAMQQLRQAIESGPAQDSTPARKALLQAQRDVQRPVASGDPSGSATDGPDWTLRQWGILIDLGIAIGLGYLLDVFGRGPGAYDTLDLQDFRTWLGTHGALSTTLAAAPLRAFYDLSFSAIGTAENWSGSIAAGVSLRAQMEMALGYRNAPLWKMAAGMGDTVFTPFFDVLRARGVRIEFFSRVTGLHVSGTQLSEIDIGVQAVTATGASYEPLTRVNELDCWPNQPDWSQLKDGWQLKAELKALGVDFESSYCNLFTGQPLTLRAGTDFDLAILAMPPDSLRPLAAELIEASLEWQQALELSSSVGTLSLQLWMKPDLKDLGWSYGPTVLTAFAEPYDSWGDMSQVIPRETWTGAVPGAIGYFCGRLPLRWNIGTPKQIQAAAKAAADEWMTSHLLTLWPDAAAPPAPPDPYTNPDVLSRYDLANFDLSDCYVSTPAGQNVASRFDPASPACFDNLYAVGDWTRTRFSGGCFESAIESAMLAARGISGFPTRIKTAEPARPGEIHGQT